MSRSLSINSYLRQSSIAIYGKFNLYYLSVCTVFKLYKFDLQIMRYLLEVPRYTKIVYTGVYLVDI